MSNELTRRCVKVRTKPVSSASHLYLSCREKKETFPTHGRAGRLRPLPRAAPRPFSLSTVKDQSVQLAIEASRKIQERSKALVRESSILIATAISLIDDVRVASERMKARKPSSRPTTRL
jgi:hypothetical protein